MNKNTKVEKKAVEEIIETPVVEETVEAPVTEEITERQLEKEYKTFKQQLAAEEHVDIMIPPTQLYPEGSSMPVCVNGVTYTIPVGIDFKKGVPKSIYEAWKTSYDADREARAKMKKVLTGKITIG